MSRYAVVIVCCAAMLAAACSSDKPAGNVEVKADVYPETAAGGYEGNPTAPVTLYEAMARGIRYNLPSRFAALKQATLTDMSASPDKEKGLLVFLNQSYKSRTRMEFENRSATDSGVTGRTGNLGTAWLAGDFALTYALAGRLRLTGAQDGEIDAMLKERAALNVMADVRLAFYRYAALQKVAPDAVKLEHDLTDLLAELDRAALDPGKTVPEETREYAKAVRLNLDQLRVLRQEMGLAKLELAALMNVDPDVDFTLSPAENDLKGYDSLSLPEMENLALRRRADLKKFYYADGALNPAKVRDEIKAAMPGVEFGDSLKTQPAAGDVYAGQRWAETGMKLAWNTVSLQNTGNDRTKTVAANMTALAGVDIAAAMVKRAYENYRVSKLSAEIAGQVEAKVKGQFGAGKPETNPVTVKAAIERMFADAREGYTLAEAKDAEGFLLRSLGAEQPPAEFMNMSIEGLAADLQRKMAAEDFELPADAKAEPTPLARAVTENEPAPDDPVAPDLIVPAVKPAEPLPAAAVPDTNRLLQLAAYDHRNAALEYWDVMRAKYPALSRYRPVVKEVDLGAKGRYYRLMVSDNPDVLKRLCVDLKEPLKGHCIVRAK